MNSSYNIGNSLLQDSNQMVVNSLSDDLTNFFRAVVVNNEDPMKLGRVQIRVPSIHGLNQNSKNYVSDLVLPWATPATWNATGNDMGQFLPPVAGTRVFVTFEAGNSSYPIYFGGIPTKIGNLKTYKSDKGVLLGSKVNIDTDDYIMDIVTGSERILFKSFKGATIVIDDFDGKEYIKIIDQSGQTFTMGNDGDLLPRRGKSLGTSSQSFIELSNNRGEKIKITDGQVYVDGDSFYVNSKSITMPNFSGGGGSQTDAYTKEETDLLLANKSRIYFEQPTVPYNVNDLWYNSNAVYRCINTRKNGSFIINDWELDTSYMTPDQVSQAITVATDNIRSEMSSTYITTEKLDESLGYTLLITSSNGDTFKNGVISTTLTAYVRRGNYDVSLDFDDNQFRWYRSSDNEQLDVLWNRQHLIGSRSVNIDQADVDGKATFNCDLVDKTSTIKYITTNLIEIFDGYDQPTSTGYWQSTIRTNSAKIPSSGTTYDKDKHAYKFNGTASYMQLSNPIPFVVGNTYEFCSDLKSYSAIQNILCSNEDDNSAVNNRIACAIAGYLVMRKNGYTMNAGVVNINRRASISLRFVAEDNVDVYINGDYAGQFIQSNWTTATALFNYIGKYCNGYIHSIRVYNRLLTPTEIVTNYQQDVSRFA